MSEWSKCRWCGDLIRWADGPDGRKEPKNPDGTTHLADCPALRYKGGRGTRRRSLVKPP